MNFLFVSGEASLIYFPTTRPGLLPFLEVLITQGPTLSQHLTQW